MADERDKPKQCRACGNWCLFDGWDWTHAWGIGINSCGGQVRPLDTPTAAERSWAAGRFKDEKIEDQ